MSGVFLTAQDPELVKYQAQEILEGVGVAAAMKAAGMRALLFCDTLGEAAEWINEPSGVLLGQQGKTYFVGVIDAARLREGGGE